MSNTYSRIQYYSLFKAFIIFFIIQAIVVILFFPIFEVDVAYRVLTFSVNIVVSIILGWRLYKQLYHLVFSYDNDGFTLKKGNKKEEKHRWSEFTRISLVRNDHGDLSVRLRNDDSFDLPTLKFGLDPFIFRWEVARLVEANRKQKGD